MALPAPTGGAITGADLTAVTTTGYSSDATLSPAIQQIWSKEILFQAMPVLRFEQFAVKKTELGVQPGLTINFMRYNNFAVDQTGSELTEGVRMEPVALTASQIQITVKEHGYATAVTELLLNASFDDVMASASRLLGRQMAQSMDTQARNTLYQDAVPFGGGAAVAPNVVFGRTAVATRTGVSPYDSGTLGTAAAPGYMSPVRSRMRLKFWLARTSPAWATPTCASSTRRRAVRSVTGLSSSKSRSTPPPATSCSVRSVACTTWSSLRPPRLLRVSVLPTSTAALVASRLPPQSPTPPS